MAVMKVSKVFAFLGISIFLVGYYDSNEKN